MQPPVCVPDVPTRARPYPFDSGAYVTVQTHIRHFAPLAHADLVTASDASNPLEPVALPGIV